MDLWQNEPPAPTDFAGIRIFRTPANGTTTGIITSETITGRPTHYAHRRTQPCEGPGCKLCETHGPARWHGWIAIATLKSHYVAVLELTALAAAPVDQYYKRHGTLRGAKIEATRIGNKTNSPVNCKVEPHDVDLRTLPKPIDMRKFLETLWYPDARRHNEPPETDQPIDTAELVAAIGNGNGHSPTPANSQNVRSKPSSRPNIRNNRPGNHPENPADAPQTPDYEEPAP